MKMLKSAASVFLAALLREILPSVRFAGDSAEWGVEAHRHNEGFLQKFMVNL